MVLPLEAGMSEQERIEFARALRNNATPEERALWRVLSAFRPRFTRQLRVGPYVADLACRKARVVVELDGSQHAGSRSDTRRTQDLEADGWKVVRFWNSEVNSNLEGVVSAIRETVEARLPPGDVFEAQPSRAGRMRTPRGRKKVPPPTPPASAGGE